MGAGVNFLETGECLSRSFPRLFSRTLTNVLNPGLALGVLAEIEEV